jgi:formylglycine-generating enzyme required for sulfatase activity
MRAGAGCAVAVAMGVACGGSKPSAVPSGATSSNAYASGAASSSNGCPVGAIAVPGGTFALAASKSKASITVKPHCLDRTEVTLAAYGTCVENGACTEPDTWGPKGNAKWCNWKRTGDFSAHPIDCVDFSQAAAYCAFVHGRLPDEAEWEWSARGYEKGSAFPWGDEIPNGRACWSGDDEDDDKDDGGGDDGPKGTCTVGSFAKGANPLGVVDLAGNVWEWTVGRETDAGKQIDRGGGWLNAVPKLLLAGNRNEVDAKGRWSSVGFRCAYDR